MKSENETNCGVKKWIMEEIPPKNTKIIFLKIDIPFFENPATPPPHHYICFCTGVYLLPRV